MLAQNFKPATDLGINDAELDALIKVLGMLERGEIKRHQLDMSSIGLGTGCGTAGCLLGWARYVSRDFKMFTNTCWVESTKQLSINDLFMFLDAPSARLAPLLNKISPSQAAFALRSYLTTGDANWAEALAAQ